MKSWKNWRKERTIWSVKHGGAGLVSSSTRLKMTERCLKRLNSLLAKDIIRNDLKAYIMKKNYY
jgi:hypothetical protein